MARTFLFQINVTRDCNLRCTHCYISSDKKAASKYMSDEQFVLAFKQIADFLHKDWIGKRAYSAVDIHVIGGEPSMLGYDFFSRNIPLVKDILDGVGQRVMFSIVSNLLTEDSVRIASLFDSVCTSYEYETRFVSVSGRQKPSLERIWIENIEKLKSMGKEPSVTMAVTKQAVQRGASKILDDFYRKGFKKIHLGFFIPSGDGLVYMDSVFPTFAQTTSFMIEAANWYVERRLCDMGLYVNPVESMIESIYDKQPLDDIICPIIPGSLDIDWDGETVTCIEAGGEVDMKSLGNIFKSSISDIINTPEYRRERANAIIAKPSCSGCDELLSCQSACGILHQYWNGVGECPGFKGFIKHVRGLVDAGVEPKKIISVREHFSSGC